MDIFPEAVEHFKRLLQMDTTNPPGRESEAIAYISGVLKKAGIETKIFESAPGRANLVAVIKGTGKQRPLLINSHVDVVHAEADKWRYPPFSAQEAEGCIWGRGAIDMKNMTAYCLASMLQLARERTPLNRDLIMTVVADEETGGHYGMGYLKKNHPELLKAEYALGELGGYTLHMGGKRIYPIQVGEKGIFWIKVKFHGEPGHGSLPNAQNAHFQLARFLNKLEGVVLPYHSTASSHAFFERLGEIFGVFKGVPYKLINSPLGPKILKKVAIKPNPLSPKLDALGAMLTNTVNPTGVEGGRQHNVVPSQLALKLDCRLLPGFTGKDLIDELEVALGEKLNYEVILEAKGFESPANTVLYKVIEREIARSDPGAFVVPILTIGFTDAQHLKDLGVTCYGFTPVKLPADMNYPELYHGHNERIPVEGFRWGLDLFQRTVKEFGLWAS